jgi:hypothetical protein
MPPTCGMIAKNMPPFCNTNMPPFCNTNMPPNFEIKPVHRETTL